MRFRELDYSGNPILAVKLIKLLNDYSSKEEYD